MLTHSPTPNTSMLVDLGVACLARGLRKRIEAQAAMLGVSASRHLQTMLWRALEAEGVRHDA